MSLPYNALVYRQANGRLHRIGADPDAPIQIAVPVWAGTLQELALGYIAAKISASENLDGLSVESQLEAAGAAGDGDAAGLAATNMGEALYRLLVENTLAPGLDSATLTPSAAAPTLTFVAVPSPVGALPAPPEPAARPDAGFAAAPGGPASVPAPAPVPAAPATPPDEAPAPLAAPPDSAIRDPHSARKPRLVFGEAPPAWGRKLTRARAAGSPAPTGAVFGQLSLFADPAASVAPAPAPTPVEPADPAEYRQRSLFADPGA